MSVSEHSSSSSRAHKSKCSPKRSSSRRCDSLPIPPDLPPEGWAPLSHVRSLPQPSSLRVHVLTPPAGAPSEKPKPPDSTRPLPPGVESHKNKDIDKMSSTGTIRRGIKATTSKLMSASTLKRPPGGVPSYGKKFNLRLH